MRLILALSWAIIEVEECVPVTSPFCTTSGPSLGFIVLFRRRAAHARSTRILRTLSDFAQTLYAVSKVDCDVVARWAIRDVSAEDLFVMTQWRAIWQSHQVGCERIQ